MAVSKINIIVQSHHPRWKTLLRPYCKTAREACEAVLLKMPSPYPSPACGRGKLQQTLLAFAEAGEGIEMTVVLADDKFIRELNKIYRGKDKATNVLAFPSLATSHLPLATHLGDLVLALETIEREAVEQEKSFKNHARHLLVHGTLHLLGYDHERKKDAARMEALEVKILASLGVKNPYL